MRPLVLATACLALSGAGARAQDAPLVRQGEILARALCADCHALGRGRASDSPAPAFAAIAALPSTTALALRVFLRSPHARMPNLILEDEQIDALAAYILDLGGKRP